MAAPNALPVRIASVTLAARDPEALARWYVETIGLADAGRDGDGHLLAVGAGAHLRLVPASTAGSGRGAAGLFHTAFRLPTRADLGRWAEAARPAIEAASDHGVSEAFYLTDPEGNGIEVYADRPEQDWPREAGGIAMTTAPMDVDDVLRAGGKAQLDLPAGADLGHVHLKVGDLDAARAFYVDRLGLTVTHRRPGALFLAFAGYHHDLAVNTWYSAGAPPRPKGAAGLVEVAIELPAELLVGLAGRLGVAPGPTVRAVDPWGTLLAFRRMA